MVTKTELLLAPVKIGVAPMRWLGGRMLDTLGFTPNLSDKQKDQYVHLNAIQALDGVSYAATTGDPRFVDLELRKVQGAIDSERITVIKITSQGVAKSYIRDAGRRQGKMPEMSEDRKLAFKRLLAEQLRDGETFESIGVDETLLPTLRTYHPEFADPPQLTFREDSGS